MTGRALCLSGGETLRLSHRFAFATAAVVLLAGLVFGRPGMAQESTGQVAGSWTVRGFGAWLHPSGDPYPFGPPIEDPPMDGIRTFPRFPLDDGSGVGLALEYRVTRRLGVEVLGLRADLDSRFELRRTGEVNTEGSDERDVSTDLYGVGLNVHLLPARRVDVYVGPLVARVRYGDFRGVVDGITFFTPIEDDAAFGITLGADIALDRSRRWAAAIALRQLWSSAESEPEFGSGRGIDVDPLIVSAGLAFRWSGF